jgi:hypothetical protein
VSEDFHTLGNTCRSVGRARGIESRVVARTRNEAMKGSVALTVDIAVIPDCLAGGIRAVYGNVGIGAGCCGNVDLFEICHADWWRLNPSRFGRTSDQNIKFLKDIGLSAAQ